MSAKTIVILSTKGGVGKTFLASNLAATLAAGKKKKTLLIDLDHQVVGDMAKMLDIRITKTAVDLIALLKTTRQEEVDVKDFLLKHSSGLDFLAGLASPQQAVYLDPQYIKDVFRLVREEYDYIIVDAGCGFSELLVSALNESNLILLVATPDVLSIAQTKWVLETLQSLLFPLSMLKVVLNRSESVSSINQFEIQQALRSEIIAYIPSDGRVVMEAVNRGVSVHTVNARSKVSRTLDEFADTLINNAKLYIERRDLEASQTAQTFAQKMGSFWRQMGMAQAPKQKKVTTKEDEVVALKKRIHNRLIAALDLKRIDSKAFSADLMDDLRTKAEKLVLNILTEETGSFIASAEIRRNLVKEIVDEALALGPLEALLEDPDITDIMVNNKDEIYIERYGKIERTKQKFTSNAHVRQTIERIIAPIGRRIDESVPMVDARLLDGSRVNAIIPPLSLTGPTLTIRKFRKERFSTEELIQIGTLNKAMNDFLQACVVSRENIIVSGGTGSGKTTVLNILSAFVPTSERIVTIEDAAELKLDQDHWVRLESRPPNIEGKGAVVIRDLFRNSLRMRPDRIVIGECRGLETLDMLQAMNTGHDGSMTTIHANSTHDVLTRLDSMILMSGVELPIRAIREMISSAVDIIVHTARLPDGSRKVLGITEVTGMKDEMHIGLEDIFAFKQTGLDDAGKVLGEFKPTGYIPSFYPALKSRGINIPEEIFKPK
ncbi:ATPase, T2SS/T4P/T4SS family [Candidatus Omnitrophota bacterium]